MLFTENGIFASQMIFADTAAPMLSVYEDNACAKKVTMEMAKRVEVSYVINRLLTTVQ